MYLNDAVRDEEVSMDLELYDTRTNTNLTAELHAPAAELGGVLQRSAPVMFAGGFALGWNPEGWDGGVVSYATLVRLALERCWPKAPMG